LGEDFITPFPVMRNIEDLKNVNIPRFETTSLNGFSTVKISPSFLLFETSFDDAYQSDPDKIKAYFETKFPLLWRVVSKDTLSYFGVVLTLHSDKEYQESTVPIIRGAFSEDKMNDEAIVDLTFSYVKKVYDRYFINVNVSGFKATETDENKGEILNPETYHGVRVNLDVNTRPVNWSSNEEAISAIPTILNKTIENAITNNTSDFIGGYPDFSFLHAPLNE
jgi:hypothetical protein